MLKVNLNKEQQFEWPVSVDVPEKGRHVTKTFTGIFTLLPQEELNVLLGFSENNQSEGQVEEIADLVERVFVGWGKDLVDEETGEPIEVSEESKSAIISNIILRKSITKAFFEAAGGKQAKVGNSKR